MEVKSVKKNFLFVDVQDRMFTQLTILIAFQYYSPKFSFLFGVLWNAWNPTKFRAWMPQLLFAVIFCYSPATIIP